MPVPTFEHSCSWASWGRQFPCDSSLLPRCAFAPQNKIVSPQLSCRCSKHLEVDVLQNKRAIMPQRQSQKVKASLPTSHACPSTNVLTEKPAESPPSAFFHLPKEAKVTPLPNKSSTFKATLWSVPSNTGHQLSIVCSQTLSLRPEAEPAHLLQALAPGDFCSLPHAQTCERLAKRWD